MRPPIALLFLLAVAPVAWGQCRTELLYETTRDISSLRFSEDRLFFLEGDVGLGEGWGLVTLDLFGDTTERIPIDGHPVSLDMLGDHALIVGILHPLFDAKEHVLQIVDPGRGVLRTVSLCESCVDTVVVAPAVDDGFLYYVAVSPPEGRIGWSRSNGRLSRIAIPAGEPELLSSDLRVQFSHPWRIEVEPDHVYVMQGGEIFRVHRSDPSLVDWNTIIGETGELIGMFERNVEELGVISAREGMNLAGERVTFVQVQFLNKGDGRWIPGPELVVPGEVTIAEVDIGAEETLLTVRGRGLFGRGFSTVYALRNLQMPGEVAHPRIAEEDHLEVESGRGEHYLLRASEEGGRVERHCPAAGRRRPVDR